MHHNYRDDLAELLHAEMKRYPDVARGMIFGHPGWKWQNRVFAFPYEDGICLKLHKADYERALALPEAAPFCPMGERPMSTWIVITYPEAEKYLERWDWIEIALAFVKTDEGAPGKGKKDRKKIKKESA